MYIFSKTDKLLHTARRLGFDKYVKVVGKSVFDSNNKGCHNNNNSNNEWFESSAAENTSFHTHTLTHIYAHIRQREMQRIRNLVLHIFWSLALWIVTSDQGKWGMLGYKHCHPTSPSSYLGDISLNISEGLVPFCAWSQIPLLRWLL